MLELTPFVLAVLAIAVIAGLPHGAFDVYIAQRLGQWKTPFQLAIWLLRYVLISALVIVFWLFTPIVGLAIFLLISALHFGRDQYSQSYLFATSMGLVILGLPMLFHGAEVALIFSYLLLTESQSQLLVQLFALLAIIGFLVIILGLSWQRFMLNHESSASQYFAVLPSLPIANFCGFVAALAIGSYALHPLLYFALFFALSHSPIHVRTQWAQLNQLQRKSAIAVLCLLTVIPVALAAVFGAMMTVTWSERIVALVFIGLAALTLPHVWLLEQQFRAAK